MIVVFDSNALIPLLLDASLSTRLFDRLKSNGHQIAASPAIMVEVAEKLRFKPTLRRWLCASDEEVERFLEKLGLELIPVPGLLETPGAVPGDPDDDHVIAAAVESRAEYLVTEDRHLLDVGVWQQVKIVTRQEMWAILEVSES